MCAVLLRKFVMQHVTPQGTNNSVPIVLSLAPQTQGLLKQELLQCIQLEQKREIRKKACEVVGQLGINLLSADQNSWPELLPFMLNATRGSAEMHEAALLIFGTFSDFISVKMQPCAEIARRSRPQRATPPRPRLLSRP